jgi:hypothetical protein
MRAGRFRPGSASRRRRISGASVCLLAILIGAAVSCRQVSEEERIVDRFKALAGLAENKKTAEIMAALSDDYRDFEGRDKAATEAMIRGYFGSYQGIVLHVLSGRVTDLRETEASLEADMTFSSGAVKALRRLVKFAGEYYRITVRWVREDGGWKASYAEWREVGLDDLFSESRDALRKIL